MPALFSRKARSPAIKALRQALNRQLDDPDWVTLGGLGAARLERALRREVGPGHKLHGQTPTALAHATASDDVLFGTEDGRLALVHLTHSGTPSGPDWPSTGFYPSVEDFVAGLRAERTHVAALEKSFALGAEHPEGTLLCPSCGADWGDAEASNDCPVCDGWALARPCPICNGTCGAIWTRAITDSRDEGIAIWIGKCQADAGSPPAT
ncbi:MAG: hypothetical protein KDK53_20355 [Maritimibacter sp.]|nr:hypothetical protein [Maritimibacter sp.]